MSIKWNEAIKEWRIALCTPLERTTENIFKWVGKGE